MISAYLITVNGLPQFVVNITPRLESGAGPIEKNCPDFKLMLDKLEELAGKDYKNFEKVNSYKDYREYFKWEYVKLPAI